MILDIIVAFAVAALAGMGVGGGALLVIYLSLVKGVDQLTSQGINLLFFIFAALSSMAVNIKKGRICLKTVLPLALSGAVFALLGAYLASGIDTSIVKKLFGALLIVSGILSFLKLGKR